jgi:hypothetical protein
MEHANKYNKNEINVQINFLISYIYYNQHYAHVWSG